MSGEVIENAKIAVISDIHGNYQALKSVLADIENKGINHIICLGDIIGKGANSKKCLDLVRETCDTVLQGNGDERFSSDPTKFEDNAVEYARITFFQKSLTDIDIQYLRGLPISTEFYLSGNLVRLFHATLDDIYRCVFNYELDFKKKYDMFKPYGPWGTEVADVVIYGHIHYQFMEKLYGKTLINCGSVGCSGCAVMEDGYDSNTEISNAHYLILSGNLNDRANGPIEFSFQSVTYDKETELEDAKVLGDVVSPGYEGVIRRGYFQGLPTVMKRFTDEGYKFIKKTRNK